MSVEISPGEHLRLTGELGTFLVRRRQDDLRGFKTSAWIRTVADGTLRTLAYGIEGLLGSTRSAREKRPLMDDIAALIALALAAEHVGSTGGSVPGVVAAYYEHVHRFARDPEPLRDAADALSLIVGLEELRRLGLIDYTDELGLCLDENIRLRYTDAGVAVGQHLWSRRH
jgi:transcription initiation factor TFIIIB Brf1 subunit/transcription initiation factor TFIIB